MEQTNTSLTVPPVLNNIICTAQCHSVEVGLSNMFMLTSPLKNVHDTVRSFPPRVKTISRRNVELKFLKPYGVVQAYQSMDSDVQCAG